jgi:nucleoid-associated protein YgaU
VELDRSLRHRRGTWRQRRLPALGAGALAALTCGLILTVHGGASSAPAHVTVQRGDTLWSIASARYAGDDVQSRVAEIKADNHLVSVALRPGQVLTLPAP